MGDRRYNATFAEAQRQKILSVPEHPLRFLLDDKGAWIARTHTSEKASIQIGHVTSLHSGAPERMMIQDSHFNQQANWKGESQGAIFINEAVLIGGVPVDKQTAQFYERDQGWPSGTVDGAPSTLGWSPQFGYAPDPIVGLSLLDHGAAGPEIQVTVPELGFDSPIPLIAFAGVPTVPLPEAHNDSENPFEAPRPDSAFTAFPAEPVDDASRVRVQWRVRVDASDGASQPEISQYAEEDFIGRLDGTAESLGLKQHVVKLEVPYLNSSAAVPLEGGETVLATLLAGPLGGLTCVAGFGLAAYGAKHFGPLESVDSPALPDHSAESSQEDSRNTKDANGSGGTDSNPDDPSGGRADAGAHDPHDIQQPPGEDTPEPSLDLNDIAPAPSDGGLPIGGLDDIGHAVSVLMGEGPQPIYPIDIDPGQADWTPPWDLVDMDPGASGDNPGVIIDPGSGQESHASSSGVLTHLESPHQESNSLELEHALPEHNFVDPALAEVPGLTVPTIHTDPSGTHGFASPSGHPSEMSAPDVATSATISVDPGSAAVAHDSDLHTRVLETYHSAVPTVPTTTEQHPPPAVPLDDHAAAAASAHAAAIH